VVDLVPFRLLVATLTGRLTDQQQDAMAYLIDETGILRRQLGGRRVRLTDAERCRLAVRGHRLGRQRLSQIATIVTPDTILRWHRQLIARKWTYPMRRQAVPACGERFINSSPAWRVRIRRGATRGFRVP